ncbi:MAG TPA: AMP-binding protein [Amycolatopsis sp.]|nr:AMP-binding protein [Amycolatopsis sp.]
MSAGAGGATWFWELVASRARQTPDRVLLGDGYGRSLTAAGLLDAAERVAAGLAAEGIGAGTRVLWQLPTTLESAVLTVALARLNAVQMPVIAMMREAELRALHEQFDPEAVVAPTHWRGFDHAEVLREICGPRVPVFVSDHTEAGDGLALPEGDPASLPAPTPEGDVRWVYTTSGSTSRPKGVKHTDASLIASAEATLVQGEIDPDDVFPMAFPFAHIGGVGWLVITFRVGCKIVLLDAFDPAESPRIMAEQEATILGSATPFFNAYLAAQREFGSEPLFPRLRLCMGGGSPVAPGLDEIVRRELGSHGLLNGYGLTECPVVGFPPLDDAQARATSSWRPGPGVKIRIVDADGAECAAGTPGELRLYAPQRFAGYLDAALDADALDEQGYVRTGDIAVADDRGLVTITGRLKEIVIRNGENISVAEVEAVLATHPAVTDVAVIGLPDPAHGERCCAVVMPAQGVAPPTLADLAAHLDAAGVARYKTPEQLELVESVPRNAMGKIQRQQLRARLLQEAV